MEQNKGYSVRDKVALVSGANRGIGRSLVLRLIEAGCSKIYAAVRTPETAQDLVNAHSDRVECIYMDLSKPETIVAAAKQASDVQIIINNAGILSNTDSLSPDAVANLEKEMKVNVYGLMNVAQQFAPVLKLNGGGVFCQINSVASFRCAVPSVATYSASKAAAFSVTQALRMSLREQGTEVISVHPGPIATDMIQGTELVKLEAESPDVVADEVVRSMETGGRFLVFPDGKSKKLSEAYKGFAQYVFDEGNMY